MANLSALNKIVKLQKFSLLSNFHNSIQQASFAASSIVFYQKYSNQIQSLVSLSQQQSQTTYNLVSQCRNYSKENESTKIPTIEEFRAREEKLEEEFSKKQEEQSSTTDDDSTAKDEAKRAKIDSVRIQILEAALIHVHTLGWSRKAIIQGAEDAGYPGVVHGMFPNGGFELVSYFYGKCNDNLVQRMREETNNGQKEISDLVDFLVNAIKQRLEMILPYKSQWPQAMAIIALPQNVSTSLAQILTLIDDICYFSGDRSVDLSWYTRRIGVATIYKMTELYMMQDSSPQYENTWKFLKNRMEEAIQLQMMLAQTGDVTHNFQRSFNSAFITARNILGLGYNRR